jgi:hypothetical protein
MSQRDSGYERKALDQYETPSWVTLALVPHLPEISGVIWEPACGGGKMVAALRQAGFEVIGTDPWRRRVRALALDFGMEPAGGYFGTLAK